MTTSNRFTQFCVGLAERDFTIHTAEYAGDTFGNWFIVFSTKGVPKHRVTWDARDRWLILQLERPEGERTVRIKPAELQKMSYLDGMTARSQLVAEAWKDKWVGRDEVEQTLDQMLHHLRYQV